jgi:hypothetical protein
VLATLNDYYGGQLLLVKSLFKMAQDAGLTTLALGKSGVAYIQDLNRGGLFVDENAVLPQSLAAELQAAHFALPLNTTFAYPAGAITLSPDNGNPTGRAGPLTFALPNGLHAPDATDRTQGAADDATCRSSGFARRTIPSTPMARARSTTARHLLRRMRGSASCRQP